MNLKPKALAGFGIAAVCFGFLAYRTYDDIAMRSDYSSLMVGGVAAIFIASLCVPASRSFLSKNSQAVRMVGWAVIALGALWFATQLYVVASQAGRPAANEWILSDMSMLLDVMTFLTGILILQIPKTILEIDARKSAGERPND